MCSSDLNGAVKARLPDSHRDTDIGAKAGVIATASVTTPNKRFMAIYLHSTGYPFDAQTIKRLTH